MNALWHFYKLTSGAMLMAMVIRLALFHCLHIWLAYQRGEERSTRREISILLWREEKRNKYKDIIWGIDCILMREIYILVMSRYERRVDGPGPDSALLYQDLIHQELWGLRSGYFSSPNSPLTQLSINCGGRRTGRDQIRARKSCPVKS